MGERFKCEFRKFPHLILPFIF
ncbi:hypothetical protein CAEBREN_01121 [Caenorhabditis brenneri]|uniref:Uncharacterized protein n=1 Tax=Caenorhabditis brenneri TaxID=135651 RepID=G0NIV2_CAEBE|nr:hypothetical protein CAEBREN_01121 [Caenorhabditis brenneri]